MGILCIHLMIIHLMIYFSECRGILPQPSVQTSQSLGTCGGDSSIQTEPNFINTQDHTLKPSHSDENQIEKTSDCVTGNKLESSSISVSCDEKVQASQQTGNLYDLDVQTSNQVVPIPAEHLGNSLVQAKSDNGLSSRCGITSTQLKANLPDLDSDKSFIMGSGESKSASREGKRKSKSPEPVNNNLKSNSLGRKSKLSSDRSSETIGIKSDGNANRNRNVRNSGNFSPVQSSELQVRHSIESDVQPSAASVSNLTHSSQVGDNELSNLGASGIEQELKGVNGAVYSGKSPSPAASKTGHYAAAGTTTTAGGGLTAGAAGFTVGQARMNNRITRSSERHFSPPPQAPPRAHRTLSGGSQARLRAQRTLSGGYKRNVAPEDALIAYHPLDATSGNYHTLPRTTGTPTTVQYKQDIPGSQHGGTGTQVKHLGLSQSKHMDQSTSGSAVLQDRLSSRDCRKEGDCRKGEDCRRKEGAHTPGPASQPHTELGLSPSTPSATSTPSAEGPGGRKEEDPLLHSVVNVDSGSLQGSGVVNKSRTLSTPITAMQTAGKQVTQASTASLVNSSNQQQGARLEITNSTISTSSISSNNEELAKLSSTIPCQNQNQQKTSEVSSVRLDSDIPSQAQVHIHSDTPSDIKSDSNRITHVTVENIQPEDSSKLHCDKQTEPVYKHAVNIAGTKDLAGGKESNTDLGSTPSSLDSFHTASPVLSFQSGFSVSPQGEEELSRTSRASQEGEVSSGQGPVILDGQIAVKDVGIAESNSKPMIFEELMSLKDVELSSDANSSALSSLESDQGKAGEVHNEGNLPTTQPPIVNQPDHPANLPDTVTPAGIPSDHPANVPVTDQARMTDTDSLLTNNTENSNTTSEMGTDYSKAVGDEGVNSCHALSEGAAHGEHHSKVRPASDGYKQSGSIPVSADLLHTAKQSVPLSSTDSSAQSNQQTLNNSRDTKLKQDNTTQHKDYTPLNQDHTSVNQDLTSVHQDNTSGQDLSSYSASPVHHKEGIVSGGGNISAGNTQGVNSGTIEEDIIRPEECKPAESSIKPGNMSAFHKDSMDSPSCTEPGQSSPALTSSDKHRVGDNTMITGNTQAGGSTRINQTLNQTGSRQNDGQTQVPVSMVTEPEVVPVVREVGAAANNLQQRRKGVNRSAQKRHSWGQEVKYLGQHFRVEGQGRGQSQEKAMWHPPPTVNIRGSLPSLNNIGKKGSSTGLTYKQAASAGGSHARVQSPASLMRFQAPATAGLPEVNNKTSSIPAVNVQAPTPPPAAQYFTAGQAGGRHQSTQPVITCRTNSGNIQPDDKNSKTIGEQQIPSARSQISGSSSSLGSSGNKAINSGGIGGNTAQSGKHVALIQSSQSAVNGPSGSRNKEGLQEAVYSAELHQDSSGLEPGTAGGQQGITAGEQKGTTQGGNTTCLKTDSIAHNLSNAQTPNQANISVGIDCSEGGNITSQDQVKSLQNTGSLGSAPSLIGSPLTTHSDTSINTPSASQNIQNININTDSESTGGLSAIQSGHSGQDSTSGQSQNALDYNINNTKDTLKVVDPHLGAESDASSFGVDIPTGSESDINLDEIVVKNMADTEELFKKEVHSEKEEVEEDCGKGLEDSGEESDDDGLVEISEDGIDSEDSDASDNGGIRRNNQLIGRSLATQKTRNDSDSESESGSRDSDDSCKKLKAKSKKIEEITIDASSTEESSNDEESSDNEGEDSDKDVKKKVKTISGDEDKPSLSECDTKAHEDCYAAKLENMGHRVGEAYFVTRRVKRRPRMVDRVTCTVSHVAVQAPDVCEVATDTYDGELVFSSEGSSDTSPSRVHWEDDSADELYRPEAYDAVLHGYYSNEEDYYEDYSEESEDIESEDETAQLGAAAAGPVKVIYSRPRPGAGLPH